MGEQLPVLWHFPISHFNEKVRWALDYKSIPHRRRALSVSYLPRAWWATGRGTLPVLILDGQAIGDSTRIITRLEQYRPAPPLYPRDDAARTRALQLEEYLDEELGPALRTVIVGGLFARDPAAALAALTTGMAAGAQRTVKLIAPAFIAFYKLRHHIDPATIETGRAKVLAALDRIERERQASGYLVGDGFTVADLTAAALLSPLTRPPQFPYPPPEPMAPSLAEYRTSLASHPAFEWALGIYERHRGASAEVR